MTTLRAVPKLGAHRLRTMLAKVLDYAAPSLREVAAQAGISYSSIREYRKARRTAPPTVIRRLAAVLRSRGGEMRRLAVDLERLAREQGRSPRTRGTR